MKTRTAPRQQRHEAQAEHAARRIAGGGRPPQHWLSPHPAGSLPGWLGGGRPLDAPLRQRLEGAFGAELDALRVHVGEGAGRWLADLGTQGAAAGHRIAIAPAAWHPGTPSGLRLLAHEVAHTLQQAGERLPDGGLRLAPRSGTAAPQGDPETMQAFYELDLAAQIDHIRAVHEAADSALHAELETWFPGLRAALLALPDAAAARDWLRRDADTRLEALRAHPRQLAVWADIAKQFDAPLGVRAVQTNPWIQTINLLPAVLDGLLIEATNAAFWGHAITEAWPAKLYLPDAFGLVIDSFLWTPPPAEDQEGFYAGIDRIQGRTTSTPADDYESMVARNDDPRRLKPSEWVEAGLLGVMHLETALLDIFRSLDQQTVDTDAQGGEFRLSRFERMRRRAVQMHALGERMAAVANGAQLGLYWWAYPVLAPVMTERAAVARDFWNEAAARQNERIGSIAASGVAGAPGDVVPGYLALPGFADEMAAPGTALAALLPALLSVPRTASRSERWRGFPAQAESFANALDEQVVLPALERAAALHGTGQADLAAALAWFAAFAESVHRVAQDTVPAAIARQESAELTPDTAMHVRWIMATRISLLASQLAPAAPAWAAVSRAVLPVDARATDLGTSDLALPQPLELDKSAEPQDLPLDQPGFSENVAPFTPADFANFFGRIRLAALAADLRTRLAARAVDATAGISDLGLMAEAQRVLNSPELQAQLPQRWLARGVLWVAFPGEPPERFSNLLDANWRVRHLDQDTTRFVLVPNSYRVAHGEPPRTIALWTVPRPALLIQRLRGIRFFNAVVHLVRNQRDLFVPEDADPETTELVLTTAAQEAIGGVSDQALAAVAALDDWTWWRTFADIHNIGGPAGRAAAGVGAEVGREFTAQAREVVELELQATNADRALVRAEIARLLEDFSGRVGDLHLLNRVLSLLQIFHDLARPAVASVDAGIDVAAWRTREARLQASALVLELAEPLAEAGTGVGLFSARRDLFPWLSHAAADADAVALRADILGGSAASRTELARQGRELLLAARTEMLATLESFQAELGIQGLSSGVLTSLLTPTRPLRIGAAVFDEDGERDLSGPRGVFQIEGLWVEIVEVMRDFTFFPRLGEPAARGEEEHTYQRASRLVLSVVTGANEGAAHVPDPANPLGLVRIRVGLAEDALHPVTITDADLDNNRSGMAWLSHVVHMDASVQSMEALGRVVDAYGRGLMFVMSLTPVGWAVDVAELIAMMAEAFADSPDSVINQIQELLTEPDVVFRRLIAVVEENLTAEHLLEAFLLGSDRFRALAAMMPNRPPSQARSPAVRRGIGGALARVRRLGAVVGTRLQRVQARVQPPVRALRGAILSRPSMATAVHWASEHWDILTNPTALEGAILQHRIAGPVYEIANLLRLRLAASGGGFSSLADLEASVGGMAQRAQDMVEQLRELELPEEIVPLEVMNRILLDAFLHFVSRRAPGKVRILTAIIMGAADLLGARDVLVEELSERMRGTRFDPNTYWREFVVPEVSGPFTEAIHALADGLDEAFTHVPLLGWFANDIARPTVSVETSTAADADFDSAETTAFETTATEPPSDAPSARTTPDDAGGASPLRLRGLPGQRPRGAAPADAAPSAGSPLSPGLRQQWERGFGHDLGHVRLHRGGDAARLTGRFGAAALTSGSRIYMAPGLSPTHGLGQHVLGHELAHVLQKTGPRPPGSDPAPQRGRGALRDRPDEEAAADRMAAQARLGRGPVRIEGAHDGGASPTPAGVVPRFLGSISDMRAVTASLDAVTTAIAGPAAADLDDGVRRTASAIWTAINSRIEAGSVSWPRFVPAADQPMALRFLRRRLESAVQVERPGGAEGLRNAGGMTEAVRVLARRAQRDAPASTTTGAGGSGAAAPARKELAESTFVRELQLYLLGRTGMSLDINSVRVTQPSSGRGTPTVHVGAIEIEDIVLRWIPSGTEPWDVVMRRTWPTVSDTSRHRQAAVRLIAEAVEPADASSGGAAPAVWDGNEFKFRDSFKTQVEDEVSPAAIDVSRLPDWNDFVATGQNDNKAAVRLRTHGDFTRSGSSWNLEQNDRQSHHTTQFLVAEYFHNVKEYKPFAADRNWPASVTFSGTGAARTVTEIASASSGGDVIRVGATFAPGRGGPMPAILLSAGTHLGSDLHITPRPDERGTASQGLAIHRHFVGHLPADIRPESPTATANAWLASNATRAPAAIYQAVQATYGDVRTEMMDKLTRNFPRAELNWYRRIAGPQFDTKTGSRSESQLVGDLDRIAQAVSAEGSGHNDTVMTVLGWDQRRGS
jgi:hypothetical protein